MRKITEKITEKNHRKFSKNGPFGIFRDFRFFEVHTILKTHTIIFLGFLELSMKNPKISEENSEKYPENIEISEEKSQKIPKNSQYIPKIIKIPKSSNKSQ